MTRGPHHLGAGRSAGSGSTWFALEPKKRSAVKFHAYVGTEAAVEAAATTYYDEGAMVVQETPEMVRTSGRATVVLRNCVRTGRLAGAYKRKKVRILCE